MSKVAGIATAVILLNWKRPDNIGRLVQTASSALPAATIFVIDHGEGPCRLAGRSDIPTGRCWLRVQANAGPGVRVRLAADWPFEYCLCIDDDIFLTGEQIRALSARLQAEPGRVHGVTGEMVIQYPGGEYLIRGGIRADTDISIVNQVYAFTRTQAQAALKLAETLGYAKWEDVGRTDDILLSCGGGIPRVHDLGPVEQCPTHDAEGIAVHRGGGFLEERAALIGRLLARHAVHVAQGRGQFDRSSVARIA